MKDDNYICTIDNTKRTVEYPNIDKPEDAKILDDILHVHVYGAEIDCWDCDKRDSISPTECSSLRKEK